MLSFSRSAFLRRAMPVVAWLTFGFSLLIMVTGIFVGRSRESVAQEPAAQQAAPEAPGAPAGETAPSPNPAAPAAEAAPVAEGASDAVAPAPPEAAEAPTPAEAPTAADAPAPAPEAPAVPQTIELRKIKSGEGSSVLDKSISFLGIFALLAIAWAMSNNRSKVDWRLVGMGVGLQLVFALFIFYVPGGQTAFEYATAAVKKLLDFTADGSAFVFSSFVTSQWEVGLINFAFAVLPTIIFFSALMTVMYHLGLMQKLVHIFAWVMQKTMRISGAESMSAAANIFVGQTEAPLVVKPYVRDMTGSELMVVMVGGFATVAGGVMAIYVGMLEPNFPDIAGHLIAASVMSAPAALVIAKVMYPEVETPRTMGTLVTDENKMDVNVLEAASRGASEGMSLALNVGAMLLAFIALIALINYLIGLPSFMYNRGVAEELLNLYAAKGLAIPEGCTLEALNDKNLMGCLSSLKGGVAEGAQAWTAPVVTLQDLFGYVFWPFAWLMGVPSQDCFYIAQLLGEKMVINELVAYGSLQKMIVNPDIELSSRSVIIATYALCGFANFSSIGIQLGGIGGIAPERRQDLARIAFKAMLGGTLAAFMTGTIAGILV